MTPDEAQPSHRSILRVRRPARVRPSDEPPEETGKARFLAAILRLAAKCERGIRRWLSPASRPFCWLCICKAKQEVSPAGSVGSRLVCHRHTLTPRRGALVSCGDRSAPTEAEAETLRKTVQWTVFLFSCVVFSGVKVKGKVAGFRPRTTTSLRPAGPVNSPYKIFTTNEVRSG